MHYCDADWACRDALETQQNDRNKASDNSCLKGLNIKQRGKACDTKYKYTARNWEGTAR